MDCAPNLHQSFNDGMARQAALEDAFERETGKRALDAWYEFEEFAER